MLFYQIVEKNEWDPQRPGWCTLGGSKIYHRKRGVSKQYFCMFFGSSTVVLPYDLHLIEYQGHSDNFKVIREKTIKVSFGFHCNHLSLHSSPKEVHIDFAQFSWWPRVTDPDPGSCQVCQMVLYFVLCCDNVHIWFVYNLLQFIQQYINSGVETPYKELSHV